jgi:hypothetical protein
MTDRSINKVDSTAYLRLLDEIHATVLPRTYLEVGVSEGRSMARVLPGTRALGIDPMPRILYPIGRAQIIRMTSDEFFASHDPRAMLGDTIDLAFVDGQHLFEAALRDFAHLERLSTPGAVILVHDCYPIDIATATRERHTAMWSGDVWKLIVCLKEYRPDLRIAVADIEPAGLGVISNLDPDSKVLDERYDEIRRRYLDVELVELGEHRAASLNRVPGTLSAIVPLLPPHPFREGDRRLLRWRRALRTNPPGATYRALRAVYGWLRAITRRPQQPRVGREG